MNSREVENLDRIFILTMFHMFSDQDSFNELKE